MFLITGCNGQLGKEIQKRLPDAIATDAGTLDITDFNAVQQFVLSNKIDTIINCAAYTAVDKAESDTELARQVNTVGPENLAKTGCKLVHISTDYVFDGDLDVSKAYVEDDELLGKIIEVKHENNLISVYQSLSSTDVKQGDTVKQGQILGKSGTSNVEKDLGNHLHFELIDNGQTVNPNDYFDKKLEEK